jgi:undecaprenyl-diphosphatase
MCDGQGDSVSLSFPSGHAATAAALYGALTVLVVERAQTPAARTACAVTGMLLVLAIGTSRVVLNVHYLSDVLAGLALGLAWLCACLLVRPRARARL